VPWSDVVLTVRRRFLTSELREKDEEPGYVIRHPRLEFGAHMQAGMTRWQTKDNRKGVFDRYTVMGFKFENPTGEVGWHITSWLSGFDPVHDYWVSSKTFCSVSIHFFYRGAPFKLIEIFEPITTGIEADERKAVLNAIAEWEHSESNTRC